MKYEAHAFVSLPKQPWLRWCRFCGLIPLRNPLSEWAVRQGCNYDEHPDLKKVTKTLGRS